MKINKIQRNSMDIYENYANIIHISEKLRIPSKDPLVTFGSENAFAKKGSVLKMSLSERLPFSRNWRFQIGEFQTLQILVQICDSQITNQWKIDENQSKIDEHLWIDENEWRSKKFLIPKQFIRGHNVNINIHKRFPWAAGYKLQAAGHRRQAAS